MGLILRFFIFFYLLNFHLRATGRTDTLYIFFLENYPYSYVKNDSIKGIEIEIMKEFISWAKYDGYDFFPVYKKFDDFDVFYKEVKTANSKVIGLGSVTINSARLKDVSFSPPYIKNVCVLLTYSGISAFRTKADIRKVFSGRGCITIKNSIYEKHLLSIKKQYLPDLKIQYAENEFVSLEAVACNSELFAYCDILAYWTYLQKYPNKTVKIQKVFTEDKDNLGLITPKISVYTQLLTEFFESGFGFISSKRYTEILEKYLSYEVTESVRIR
jgi:ABC-type amino acid transport substrate-binding protein